MPNEVATMQWYFNVTHLPFSHGIPLLTMRNVRGKIHSRVSEKCFDMRLGGYIPRPRRGQVADMLKRAHIVLFQQPAPETISHIMLAVVTEGWLRKRKASRVRKRTGTEGGGAASCREQTDFLPKFNRNSVAHCTRL